MQAIITINKKSSHKSNLSVFTEETQLLKICGKELLLYYFELLNELNVRKIFILGTKLEKICRFLTKTSILIPQLEFVQEKDLEVFYKKNHKKLSLDDLLILENTGFIFNSFNKIKDLLSFKKNDFLIEDKSFKVYFIQKDSKAENLENFFISKILDIHEIISISDYVSVSNKLIKNLDNKDYIRGYNSKENLLIGKNVSIDYTCILIKPLVILDNVKISKNCTIGPNTIISDNVYIEENTQIVNSIVQDNVSISKNLLIDNKIVLKNRIINKSDLKLFEIDDNFISKNNDLLSSFFK